MEQGIKKVAIFRSVEYGYENIQEDSFESVDNYYRLSEYEEVYFTPIPERDVVISEVNALKDQKQTIQAETQVKVDRIDKKINTLLGIEHNPGSAIDGEWDDDDDIPF